MLALALLLVGAVLAAAAADGNETRTADSAVACGMKYADLNKDGKLSLREVEVIRDLALGHFRADVLWLAGKIPIKKLQEAISVQQIFDDCDADHDGYITMLDFYKNRATCLETKGKVDDAYYWICDKGAKGVFKHATVD